MKTNFPYYQEIFALSSADRLKLVQDILESIELEDGSGISKEWIEELDRRSKNLKEGKSKLYSWKEIKASILNEE